MRLFRRAREAKPSVVRREGVSANAESSAPLALVPSVPPSSRRSTAPETEALAVVPLAPSSSDHLEDSDVFLCPSGTEAARAIREVTLFVHGWHNAEPGLLSWTFPSLRAALDAVKRIKNAIAWCVVSGTGWSDLDSARASGAVLVEQLA